MFHRSLARCASDERFIPSFYERFLASSDEVRSKFVDTDFERQNAMLLKSLRLSVGATEGDPAALREMKERARSHDRRHLDIKPELYQYWLRSLIATASDFDAKWDYDVERAWNEILGHVIKHMTRHY